MNVWHAIILSLIVRNVVIPLFVMNVYQLLHRRKMVFANVILTITGMLIQIAHRVNVMDS